MQMTLRLSDVPKDPYLGYDALQVARLGAACLQCPSPAPCTLSCARGADIPRVMRLAGQAACEGLALTRWFLDSERVESARICDAISDAYS
jgi:NADPH-dependent glutamate synthase beta subunit-like oxidoreductase